MWERHHVGDVGDAGGEGDEAIEAEGVAGAGGHAFGERSEEALVDGVDGFVLLAAARSIALEAGALLARIGELAEAVAELDGADVELEAFAELGSLGHAPRERCLARGIGVEHDGPIERGEGGLDAIDERQEVAIFVVLGEAQHLGFVDAGMALEGLGDGHA